MRRRGVAAVLLGVAVLAVGAAGKPATSEGYAYATYRETSDRLTVLVDSYPAMLRAGERYVPIVVAVGLKGPGPTVVVTPESFTLLDQGGTEHPVASFEEIARGYPMRQADDALLRSRPMTTGNQFGTSLRLPADFFPAVGGRGLRIERIELAPFTWFRTLLYFTRPERGLRGVLTLRMAGGGIDPPVDVRFEVPGIPAGTAE